MRRGGFVYFPTTRAQRACYISFIYLFIYYNAGTFFNVLALILLLYICVVGVISCLFM